MNTLYKKSSKKTKSKTHWKRDKVVDNVVKFESAEQKQSQRQYCHSHEIPRTTFQHWIKRKKNIDESPVVIDFFESTEGLAVLHRILTALHFEFSKHGVASIHNISNFLELSGLSSFVAASYGTHQKVSKNMDEAIIKFEQSERNRLSRLMPQKKITICEDETFHPEICLVGIEPKSNFIFLEKYVSNRDGKTWNQEIIQALSGLPVQVIQVTSDEGRGLINHVTKGLKVHHSPDIFHVPYEISKGTSGALCSLVKQAEKELFKAQKKSQKQKDVKERYDGLKKRPRGRRPDFEKKIATAKAEEQQADEKLKKAQQNQETVKKATSQIGQVYHPYNPETGERQNAEKVEQLLESCFDKIYEATQSLTDRCKKRIDKAHRVVNKLRDSVAFFFCMINVIIENMNISAQEQKLMHEYLIPGFYLQQAANKEKDPDRKLIISKKSKELLFVLHNRNGPLTFNDDERLRILEKGAKECAQIFQRSSSCVEGRNAQLSLRHHGIHRLSNKKLRAYTAVHNYYIKRPDGTTAAERLSGVKPNDIFQWLLDNMDFPARPRRRMARAS